MATRTTDTGSTSFSFFETVHSYAEETIRDAVAEVSRKRPRSRADFMFKRGGAGEKCLGDIRLERLRKVLDSFGLQRSRTQRRMHDNMAQALCPLLFGTADFERHADRIMRENGWSRICQQVMGQTPRRWGKTYVQPALRADK